LPLKGKDVLYNILLKPFVIIIKDFRKVILTEADRIGGQQIIR